MIIADVVFTGGMTGRRVAGSRGARMSKTCRMQANVMNSELSAKFRPGHILEDREMSKEMESKRWSTHDD